MKTFDVTRLGPRQLELLAAILRSCDDRLAYNSFGRIMRFGNLHRKEQDA